MSQKIRIDFARVKKLITLVILAAMAIGAIIFAEMNYRDIKCTGIVIKLDSENERPLLSKQDINVMVTNQGTDYFVDKPLDEISLHKIEQRVKKIPLVKSCEAHHDFSGKIIISVKEYRPIARILHFTSGESNYKDQYVTHEGKFIGTSSLFTPRVLIASGPFFTGKRKDLLDERGKTLIPLFEFINNDDFWRAQITQVIVAADGGVVLIPAMGQTYIDFGLPIKIETKFKKLALFYKKIIPNKGWNTYHWVHLKYKNQVICD
ncbi:cell division protein FtsQ/DivIB [Aquirufa regiilacus]